MVSKVHTSLFAACEFAFIATTFILIKVPLLNVIFLYSSEFPYVKGQYKNGLQSRWVEITVKCQLFIACLYLTRKLGFQNQRPYLQVQSCSSDYKVMMLPDPSVMFQNTLPPCVLTEV